MSYPKITSEEIQCVIEDHYAQNGKEPSLKQLHQHFNKGSLSTYSAELKKWRESKSPTAETEDLFETLRTPQMQEKLLRLCLSLFSERIQSILAEKQAVMTRKAEDCEADVEAVLVQLRQKEQIIEDLYTQLNEQKDRLQAVNDDFVKKLEGLSVERGILIERLSLAEKNNLQLKADNEVLTAKLEAKEAKAQVGKKAPKTPLSIEGN